MGNDKGFSFIKKIRLSAIDGYEEINQLRLLNNSIKHSLKAKPSDLKGIKEFQGKDDVQFQDFLNFYKRIEGHLIIFISSLSDKIETDLYQFDEDRLEALSDSFKERMDNPTLEKFISKLDPAK